MQFGNSDVYDVSAISLASDKIPGPRGFTDKNNDRGKGKGAGWQGRRDANCAELRERTPRRLIIIIYRLKVGIVKNVEYREIWGGQTSDVRCAGDAIDSPS